MMTVKSICVTILCFVLATGRAQDAALYLAAIETEFQAVQLASWQYVRAASKHSPSKAEKKRQALLYALSNGISNISAIPPFNGDAALRDSALLFLRINQAVATEDFGQVVNLEPVAEQAYDAMEAYMMARKRGQQRLANYAQVMEDQYQQFAQEHALKLSKERTPVAANLETAASVYNHYNNIYALFFENYKQESYFLSAMMKSDISTIDQNRQALQNTAERGLTELEDMEQFRKDAQFRNACRKLLLFYRNEAAVVLEDAPDFFVEKDNMNKLHEAYMARVGKENEDTDKARYLEAVKHFTERAENFEKKYMALESKRNSLLVAFNRAAENFIRRNIP